MVQARSRWLRMFGRRKARGCYTNYKGQMGIWYYFDLVPYVDMLLVDVKLHIHRWS